MEKILAERKERYAKAMEILLSQINDIVEDTVPDWLNNNSFWYDKRATKKDAREDLFEQFIENAGDDLHDFAEFVAYELNDMPMSKNNPFVKVYEERPFDKSVKSLNETIADTMAIFGSVK